MTYIYIYIYIYICVCVYLNLVPVILIEIRQLCQISTTLTKIRRHWSDFNETSRNLANAAEFQPPSPESCHQLRFALVIFSYEPKAKKYFQRNHLFSLKN
jgi:predicted protein tyrosine phosphatase